MSEWDKAIASVKNARVLTKRHRTLRGYLREAGGYTTWGEVQVVEGRRIVWRAETTDQADSFIAAALAALAARIK